MSPAFVQPGNAKIQKATGCRTDGNSSGASMVVGTITPLPRAFCQTQGCWPYTCAAGEHLAARLNTGLHSSRIIPVRRTHLQLTRTAAAERHVIFTLNRQLLIRPQQHHHRLFSTSRAWLDIGPNGTMTELAAAHKWFAKVAAVVPTSAPSDYQERAPLVVAQKCNLPRGDR